MRCHAFSCAKMLSAAMLSHKMLYQYDVGSLRGAANKLVSDALTCCLMLRVLLSYQSMHKCGAVCFANML